MRVREAMLFIAKKKTEKGLLNQFGGRKRLYIITMREEDLFEIYFGSKSYSEVGTLHNKSRDDCSFLICI